MNVQRIELPMRPRPIGPTALPLIVATIVVDYVSEGSLYTEGICTKAWWTGKMFRGMKHREWNPYMGNIREAVLSEFGLSPPHSVIRSIFSIAIGQRHHDGDSVPGGDTLLRLHRLDLKRKIRVVSRDSRVSNATKWSTRRDLSRTGNHSLIGWI